MADKAPTPQTNKPSTPATAENKAIDDKVVVAVKQPKVEEIVEPEALVLTSTVHQDGDDENVVKLKSLLDSFVKANDRPGTRPEDFRQSANLALQITDLVTKVARTPVLDAFLAFFEEHGNDTAAGENIMKGSTALSKTDEQRVGYLFAMFTDLARGKVGRVNNGQVIHVLKSPEILGYYDRKMANFRQVALASGR